MTFNFSAKIIISNILFMMVLLVFCLKMHSLEKPFLKKSAPLQIDLEYTEVNSDTMNDVSSDNETSDYDVTLSMMNNFFFIEKKVSIHAFQVINQVNWLRVFSPPPEIL